MKRYSALPTPKVNDFIASMQLQKSEDYKIITWDPDADEYIPITGYVIDPESKTITLYCDKQ